ncbi:unnamed protein product [Trichobilharzia regenti]|nr:unnamed protein product [Trichobilharzia regenti]
MKKEKLIENLKLTEINLQNTIESQRTQVKTLISEKKQISQNFSHLKEAHNHVVHELDELKESFLSLKLKQQVNTNQTDDVHFSKYAQRNNNNETSCLMSCYFLTQQVDNDRTEHLEKLILYLANELIRIIKLAYQLCIDSSATTTMATTTTTTTTTKTTERDTNRPTKKYTSPDGKLTSESYLYIT